MCAGNRNTIVHSVAMPTDLSRLNLQTCEGIVQRAVLIYKVLVSNKVSKHFENNQIGAYFETKLIV
jgi:hypothetical protein